MDPSRYVNPYIAGSPVTGTEMFFGREDVFSFVQRNLTGRHRDSPIVLYGQRRTGKTSVLYQMHRHLDPRYRCVFIDLHGLSLDGVGNLLWGVANSIKRGLQRDHDLRVAAPDKTTFGADPYTAFEAVFLDDVWSVLGDDHLVLMIDEVVRIEEEIQTGRLEREVFDYLRHLMQHFEKLNFIFSMGSGLEEMEKEYAFLFSVSLYHRISFLEASAARALITQPAGEHYLVIPDAVKKILEITSGHAYYTQLLCHCLFDRWLRSPKPEMTAADVEAVLTETIELGSANLTYVWEDSAPEEQGMMAGMAAAMRAKGRPVTIDEIRQVWRHAGVSLPQGVAASAIRSLTSREVVTGLAELSPAAEMTDPSSGAYSFTVDLQRLWLEKHRPLDWVKEELAKAAREWDPPAQPVATAVVTQVEAPDGQDDRDSTPSGLFISYRQGATTGQASALHDSLAQHFGEDRLFMRVDSIAPGADSPEKVEEAIGLSGVVLVLIGSDWMGPVGGKSLIGDPGDFVRLEVSTALQRKIPTIPILVEHTPMPAPDDLPESLRPLVGRNALELKNSRWDYDVSRLVKTVEPLVGSGPPAAGPRPVPTSVRTARFSRRTLVGTVGAAAVVAAVVILALMLVGPAAKPPPKPKSAPPPPSAANAVAAVHSDRLAEALMDSSFAQNEVPSGTTESSTLLNDFRAAGLVVSTYTIFLSPDASIYIHYYVYDNQDAASSAFGDENPVPIGYKTTGSFIAGGIGDLSKCGTGQAANKWITSSCLTLSNKVVGYAVVDSNSDSIAATERLDRTLVRDTILHLHDVAGKTEKTALPPPPGHLTPSALFNRLEQSPFSPAWLPLALTAPTVQAYRNDSILPGLIKGSYVQVNFVGPDYGDEISFFLFSAPQDAQSWFHTNLQVANATKTSPIDSSGFSQPSQCGTYSRSASKQTPKPVGISACFALWGNVVIEGETQSSTNKQAADNNMAATLTRIGIIYLDQILQ